jgi:hypothetical protein
MLGVQGRDFGCRLADSHALVLTPAKRLKFESLRARQILGRRSLDFARDISLRLRSGQALRTPTRRLRRLAHARKSGSYFHDGGGSGSAEPSARASDPPKFTLVFESCITALPRPMCVEYSSVTCN